MKELDLQDPFQGRRWLRLLRPDPDCGFRLTPGASRRREELGFSCTANRLGLRGPCDEGASSVVFGTSYAMAVGANDGEAWHDLALPASGWLNLGLAVGVREWMELERAHHRGPKKRALLIYHPNIWAHCLMYERWRASGLDVFDALRWRRDLLSCAVLAFRRRWRERARGRSGDVLRFLHDGRHYVIDARYARISAKEHGDLVSRNLALLYRLLEPFETVWCVRVPIKQELVPPRHRNTVLADTLCTYSELWQRTRETLKSLPHVECVEFNGGSLEDYHPHDTHWNASGNARFARWLTSGWLAPATVEREAVQVSVTYAS